MQRTGIFSRGLLRLSCVFLASCMPDELGSIWTYFFKNLLFDSNYTQEVRKKKTKEIVNIVALFAPSILFKGEWPSSESDVSEGELERRRRELLKELDIE